MAARPLTAPDSPPEGREQAQASETPLIETQGLSKHFALRRSLLGGLTGGGAVLKAVDGIDLEIHEGEAFGLAGESGCGKSTLAQLLLRMYRPTEGTVLFKGRDLFNMGPVEVKEFRSQAQLVFQNPFEALNPRFTIQRSIMEPLIIHGIGKSRGERVQRVHELLEQVNLTPPEAFVHRYPQGLSGGQLQRAVLARALAPEPEFLVADEPVSMLDVSVRASILNLMRRIAGEMNLTTLYISHDLSLIRYMCDTTVIMYLGRVSEIGPTESVIEAPQHPYSRALVGAVPVPDPDDRSSTVEITSRVPDPVDLPPGCRFADRCPEVMDVCRQEEPPTYEVGEGHRSRCFLHDRTADETGRDPGGEKP